MVDVNKCNTNKPHSDQYYDRNTLGHVHIKVRKYNQLQNRPFSFFWVYFHNFHQIFLKISEYHPIIKYNRLASPNYLFFVVGHQYGKFRNFLLLCLLRLTELQISVGNMILRAKLTVLNISLVKGHWYDRLLGIFWQIM
jgi:hypothetical protein